MKMANDSARKEQRAMSQARQEFAEARTLGVLDGHQEVSGQASLDELVKEVAALRKDYKKERDQLAADRADFERQSTKLADEKSEWTAQKNSLAERERDYIERVERVTALELDAETGFAD